jgi:hypothetical protein
VLRGLLRGTCPPVADDFGGARLSANVGFVNLNVTGKHRVILCHEFGADQVAHPPCRFVRHANLAFNLLGGDPTASASHQVHREEPPVQRGRRLRKDRSGERVQVVAAGVAVPCGAIRHLVELAQALALRALRVGAVFGVALTPEPFKAGRVVGELAHEFHERVVGCGRVGALWLVAIYGRHCHI